MRDNAQELNMNWRERLPSSVDDRLWHIPAPSGVSGPFGFGIVEPVSPISAAALAVNNGAGRPRRQRAEAIIPMAHSRASFASGPNLPFAVAPAMWSIVGNRPIYAALTSVWPVDFQFHGRSSSSFGFM